MEARIRESLSGPHSSRPQSDWDSVTLHLQSDGRFELELWHFYESWDYIQEDVPIGSPEPSISSASSSSVSASALSGVGVSGVPLERADHPREVEEVRVTFKGQFAIHRVASLRFNNFGRRELNQEFAEDVEQRVCDLPTWWSADGQIFLHYSDLERKWFANSVRVAGGNGLKGARGINRRASRSFAWTQEVSGFEKPTDMLHSGAIWYEEEGGWDEASARRGTVAKAEAWALNFMGERVLLEESHARGSEGTSRDSHEGEPVAFRGWRHGGPTGSDVRIVLPPLPHRLGGEDNVQEAVIESLKPGTLNVKAASNLLGDPDAVVLRPTARL